MILFMIEDPPEGIKKEPVFKKIKTLSKKQIVALKSNANLALGMVLVIFVGGPMVIFEIFIMSWLRAFNVEGGPIKDEDEVYKLY